MGVVVPCFNEVSRLNFDFFKELHSQLDCKLIFVDDGSTDGTGELIRKELISLKSEVEVLTLPSNRGKAAAIAKGLELVKAKRMKSVIFCDADNSLKVEDIVHLYKRFVANSDLDVISGARVPLAGSDVLRRDLRKWSGRVVATLISRMTHIAIYDPMSPLKIYNLDRLRKAPAYIPSTRWLGEVELMFYVYNIERETFKIEEVPIQFWRDQADGHVGIRSSIILIKDFYNLKKRISKLGEKPALIHQNVLRNK